MISINTRCPKCQVRIESKDLAEHLVEIHHLSTTDDLYRHFLSISEYSKQLEKAAKNPKNKRLGNDLKHIYAAHTSSDPRDFSEDIPRCPHGVLLTAPCAICDPKGFRRETGID